MRSLAAILYLLILGFLVVAGYFVDDIGTRYYREEISEEYLHYSRLITSAIEQNLAMKASEQNSTNTNNPKTIDSAELNRVLNFWRKNVGKELVSLSVVDRPITLSNNLKGTVSSLSVTDKTDELTVLIPLSQKINSKKALKFDYTSEYSEDYMMFYYLSTIAVYSFMALIITLIAWSIYRYINQISRVTHSVAEGDFNWKMSPSKIPALKKLSDDINSMANSIEEKTAENLILTGAIHHELRIPITRMRLALDIALNGKANGDLTGEVSELLSGMDNDLEELASLTEEILTISRMRLRSVETRSDSLHFPTLLTSLIASIESSKVTLLKCDEFTLTANRTLL
ncbi:MAG: hypothetical protein OQK04_09410 [Kangiellaceae bacterium]|nr:hypothetical protein [Kangiellaceae bacterium]